MSPLAIFPVEKYAWNPVTAAVLFHDPEMVTQSEYPTPAES